MNIMTKQEKINAIEVLGNLLDLIGIENEEGEFQLTMKKNWDEDQQNIIQDKIIELVKSL